jgi:hypothetical protein
VSSVRLTVAGVAAVLVTALAGCSSDHPAGDPDADAGTAALQPASTACAKDATAKPLPSGFPADFPLPAGTVVTSAEDRGSGGLVIEGVTPTAFTDVLHGLQTSLPANGFTPSNGETEPHDAESDWSSATFTGRWAIRELEQCGGQTAVSVVARKK